MIQSTEEPIFSLIDLEREIAAEVKIALAAREHRPVSVPLMVDAPTLAMPDYVQHRQEASEIGTLSAEAAVREYEAAAQEMSAMGAELIERVRQCEKISRDALAVTEEMRETAGRYRTEAKRIFLKIESCSVMTAEVRTTCIELKQRIAAPNPSLKTVPVS
jgi:hypothetical protein